MSRIALVSLILAVTVGLAAGAGQAQLTRLVGPEREALLYDGDVEVDSGGIRVTPWGSGKAESVYEATYVGPQVLKVTSQGPYQGIVLHFARPGDLAEFLASNAGYLDLRISPAQTRLQIREREQAREERRARSIAARGGRAGGTRAGIGGARGGAGARGAMGGGGGRGGGMRGGGMRGGAGGGMRGAGMGRAGAGGAGAGYAAPGQQPGQRVALGDLGGPADEKIFVLRNVRVVLFTDQGPMIADAVPVGLVPRDERGWTQVTVPLPHFRGAGSGASVRAVGVFADESDVFYLGRVGLLVDRRPVEISVKADPSITFANRVVEFSVEVRGGPIIPRFSWDFDKSDGVQEEALGPTVKFIYKRPGDYLATCTVTDRGGMQAEIVKSVGVRVEGSA